ncbi:MAG: FAD-binding and (Fe-S)-binding domain-containing protein [Acidiferrobacterales bacterium]
MTATRSDYKDTLPERYSRFSADLEAAVPGQHIVSDPLRTLAYGSDASFYRLIPKLVVKVESEDEVARVLRLARRHAVPVTFRAAGTSVSGQAISDSVLLILGDGWQGYEINADATQIRLQPGVIGGKANRVLARFHRKIGPDPASINIATIGGIAANNSSGMCCVTAQDSYHTLVSARLILADGAVVDTGNAASRSAFQASHRELLGAIDALARHTRANRALANRIRKKFTIRNTCGYSLNALIDFEDPIDIVQHLMIGSEGTLGFIAEITYRTVEDPPHKASTLALFPDVQTACEAATRVKQAPVAAVELMDRSALRSVEGRPGMLDYLMDLPSESASLLIETRAADRSGLKAQTQEVKGAIGALPTLRPLQFTDKVEEYTKLWRIRQGLYPSVGAMRATGTSVVTEDVVFPLAELAPATMDLQGLLNRHAYDEAIVFGHALEGNLHIIFTEDFGHADAIDRYRRFLDDYAELVVDKYDGSLKGEHGTGRNMAPFVEREWGQEAYALMREIKSVLDPDNILNPGVVLNDDRQIHLKNLKALYPVDPLVDKCIECGACELACPSNALTLTPRQRIVVLRELARLDASGGDPARAQALRAHYRYQGVQTCAGDGLCALACPVDIDTGEMMKRLYARHIGRIGNKAADWLADHFGVAARVTRGTLAVANGAHALLGSALMQQLAHGARKLSAGYIPQWNRYMPTPGRVLSLTSDVNGKQARVVYFPSCVSRTMGPARGDPEHELLPVKTEALLRKAGYAVIYPQQVERLCCGLAFHSRGAAAQGDAKLREAERALRQASRDGKDLIVSDTSPCSLRFKQTLPAGLDVLDVAEFLHDHVLDRVKLRRLPERVALHPTCSTRRMDLQKKLTRIAEACADEVIVPDGVACCGWAGDKGFTVPELSTSALRNLSELLPADCDAGYSTSRTCEIGLSCHSGRYYRSIVYLVDRCAH